MRVNGIIAEYNPFHNGHKYQLEEARRNTGADYTIIAMSGNFMQRGAPAILNKYARAEAALRNGADLVLELPCFFALGSAEYFSMGAVSLLDRLGVVDHLCFGSECGDTEKLERIAGILAEEPESYRVRLRGRLRQGCSFPTARSLALAENCPGMEDAHGIFRFPNNILGIEYLKALRRRGSSIKPHTILRAGSDYHDKRLGNGQSSAMAIRHGIFSGRKLSFLKGHMPDSACEIFFRTWETERPVHPDDFSLPLHYKLLSEEKGGYHKYLDVSRDFSGRILNNLYQYTNFRDFCSLLKSRDLTYTRISRSLMHILLEIDDDALEACREMDYAPYARILGFRRAAVPLLAAIKENTSVPLLSKLADADKLLGRTALTLLERDIFASNIYNSVSAAKSGTPMRNEYSTPLVIVDN